jgi:hypothetical protein
MTLKPKLFALLLSVVAAPVLGQQVAGPPTYNIELVVFRGSDAAGGEDLTLSGALTADDADSGGGNTTGPSRLVQVLPADRRRLGDVVSRLNASGTYRVVAHAAWQQTAAAFNSRGGLAADQLGLATNGLSGLASLQRGQYLHLGLNLTWSSAGGSFTINERRRVRINERMYFDHPAFGVIALVTPGAP